MEAQLARRGRTKSPLLALPLELRECIYRFALLKPNFVHYQFHAGQLELRAVPPLLQVCRQIRTETLPMYFGNNTFSFAVGTGLRHQMADFLCRIGRKSLPFCTSVMVVGSACGMCERYNNFHSYEINFKNKTVKQLPSRRHCEADDRGYLQFAMDHLPQIIRGIEFEGPNRSSLVRLAAEIDDALSSDDKSERTFGTREEMNRR